MYKNSRDCMVIGHIYQLAEQDWTIYETPVILIGAGDYGMH